jgi:hypothetical protein
MHGGSGRVLNAMIFAKVFTSPLQRPRPTCDQTGFRAVAEIDMTWWEGNKVNMKA